MLCINNLCYKVSAFFISSMEVFRKCRISRRPIYIPHSMLLITLRQHIYMHIHTWWWQRQYVCTALNIIWLGLINFLTMVQTGSEYCTHMSLWHWRLMITSLTWSLVIIAASWNNYQMKHQNPLNGLSLLFHRVNTPADLELLKWHLSDDIFGIEAANNKVACWILQFVCFMDPDQDT